MAAGVGMYALTLFTTMVVPVVLQLHKHHEAQEQDQVTRSVAGEHRLGTLGK